MMHKFNQYMPTKIVFATGALAKLNEHIAGRNTLLVTSKSFVSRGITAQITDSCSTVIHILNDIESHPTIDFLANKYSRLKKIDFDLIVALGGGSVMDSAKVFSVQGPHASFDDVAGLIKNTMSEKSFSFTPIIHVPTTAGTGSELTPWATVWDKAEKKKYSLHHRSLFAEVAIYDPALTLSLSKEVTVSTALDALSHSLESIWNKNATPISLMNATKAIKLILANLPLAISDLSQLQYRYNLMLATMHSALAFSQTQTAIAHAMSYYITSHKGLEHGLACSITLPHLIDTVIGQYDFVDQALNESFGELTSKPIRALFKALNIETELSSYLSSDEIVELKQSLSNNPRSSNSLIKQLQL